ncbi:MAG: 1-deoxy-D-xylulose-5-phosphate synthase [Acutalibacteraceae bacterium]
MDYKFLSNIKSPADIKSLTIEQLNALCEEIRFKLVETVSKNGGHLAPNLGVVELTVALHKVLNSPKDQIVFDVGHQCYTHKLLTGRYESFDTLRTKGGISGFCRPGESEHDIFYSGHSGTSVSSGLGLAQAKLLQNDDSFVVSVIGDGSFTGGMVYEALNNGGRTKARQIIILNDNKMSISENVGAFAKYLAVIRSKPEYNSFKASTERVLSHIPMGTKIVKRLYDIKTDVKNKLYSQSTFFEDLGYRYMGPVDGHNIKTLCDALETAKAVNVPVVLHVLTVKGKGYEHAEKSPSLFHGISKFDIETGEPISSGLSFSDKFGQCICEKAEIDDSICAITAAMGLGTGLKAFSEKYPDRFFDVGIAEEHAVTFASGLAKNGMKPVYAVYSTFLQRCYDQLIHDISLQNLKVIFAVDRAGFVGEDGETHHGIFDVAFLSTVPNLKIYSPCCYRSLTADINNALYADEYSVAVRYPRGAPKENVEKLKYNSIEYAFYPNEDAENVIVTYGRITGYAIEAVDALKEKNIDIYLFSLNQIKPLPEEVIEKLLFKKKIWFFEEGQRSGGIGEKIAFRLLEKGYKGKFSLTAVEDEFSPQASVDELLQLYGLDSTSMIKKISGEIND